MAKEELDQYRNRVGHDGLSGYDQELYSLYTQLNAHEQHTCTANISPPEVAGILMLGCVAGALVKRIL